MISNVITGSRAAMADLGDDEAVRGTTAPAPAQNRVTPLGNIVAIPLRGAWLGNRGILHERRTVVRNHTHQRWITCALRHKDWRLPQWTPGRFTVLFFHDEAVSLAAGHRPCALCRRADYNAYRRAWARAFGSDAPSADEMDRVLHRERMERHTRRRRLHEARWPDLARGAFVLLADGPAVVLDDAVVPWSTEGYAAPLARPCSGPATLVTPPATVAALRSGYRAQLAVD